jgi:hypothetical protein
MYSIGAIAAQAAAGLTDIAGRLPWTWFALMAAVDVGLMVYVMRRRLAAHGDASRRGNVQAARPEALVLRDGWWVPQSRARKVRRRRATYAWPLHREYMVCRVV